MISTLDDFTILEPCSSRHHQKNNNNNKLGLGLELGLGLGLGGANLNRKTLGGELLPERRMLVINVLMARVKIHEQSLDNAVLMWSL